MSAKDGGPAFPIHGTMGEVAHEGMTLRQWYAGMALPSVINGAVALALTGVAGGREELLAKNLSVKAFELADAMLSAEEKR